MVCLLNPVFVCNVLRDTFCEPSRKDSLTVPESRPYCFSDGNNVLISAACSQPRSVVPISGLYPVYIRGLAFLTARNGAAAAREFQKIIDHRSIVLNLPLGALAHLQLGRAYVLSGNTAKARTAYQDFFNVWKDADLDIPILKEAKAEYAKLQ